MTTDYGPVTIWATIVVIGVATYSIRLSFIYLFGRIEAVPPNVKRVLQFVPPAVLAALTIPAIVTLQPTVAETVLDARLIAGLVAGIVAWRTENVLATIVAGMGSLWIVRFFIL